MQGLRCNFALFWAPEKARMRQANSDFIPLLATPEIVGVTTHLWAPGEGRGEAANSDFLPAHGVGDPREWRVT